MALARKLLVALWKYLENRRAAGGSGGDRLGQEAEVHRCVTAQEFSAILDHLESATSIVSFLVSFPLFVAKFVYFFVSFLKIERQFWISFLVSIRSAGPLGGGAFVFGWPKWANCVKAVSAFLLASLEFAGPGDMLARVVSELRCAPVELDHRLINMCEAQRSFDRSQDVKKP